MPVTHGSTTKSGDHAVSFAWTCPTPHELYRAELREGSVLGEAVRRAGAEHRSPRRTPAGFDNCLV